ncbi:TIGD4 [Cordylochernes scorpioides]|uniref:TIGD4 n=1 Tax=Cordylochernes scorpioides TaxID=51811 RepID=A0ABY6KXA1_9ARAC|nr:TIGD4 [Cordylochernes scorpioides]
MKLLVSHWIYLLMKIPKYIATMILNPSWNLKTKNLVQLPVSMWGDQSRRWKTSEWQSTKVRIRSYNIMSHLPGPKRDGKNIITAVGAYRKFIPNKIVEKIVCNTNQYNSRIRGNFSRERDAKDTNDVEIWALIGLLLLSGARKACHLSFQEIWADDGTGFEIFQSVQNCEQFLFLVSSTLKRDRDGEFPEIEEALFRWIRQANAMKLAINGKILKEKAILLALKMGQDNFEASNGWLEKFKARRNIAFKLLHGEAGSVDANSVATWKGGIIPSLLAKYSPQDIFNADETGLFYKLLPNQTMTIRGEKCEGGKKSKERITVLVCCNMDGSEKLPLLYIGKYRRPRCFHGMNIPSNYHFNKKAWMTGAIFTDWLKKLDQIFKRRERNCLLILDNCPAHQIPEGLQNIEIRFLPALTTSALQPCVIWVSLKP